MQSSTGESAPTLPARGGRGAPWVVVQERPAGFARLAPIAFWGTVALVALVAARSLVAPDEQAPQVLPAPGPTVAGYPEDGARAVAVRAARAYLTWDEAKPADRARELSALLAAGVDPQLGWDGRGAQAVGLVVPGPVTVGKAGRARVRVDAEITSGAVRWVAVDVPVVVGGGGRLVVSGPPALLGVPEGAAIAPDPATRATDLPFSAATRAAVADFFKAWATGGAAQAAAPGAAVPALPAGVELRAVQAWEAAGGTGADRWGTARVVWGIGGGEITQEYRVALTRVESARAGRWQVAGITGDDLS
ncbi:conjugal transfer protein [Streptomyces sp. Isolate_45]|uniref:conjugal transfer protein n=1 Tax=Streptomyces sp. Isolate_45 TaxID=2950111 RepID=UPI002481D45A|nr:conjugal transfer protein [Streptomyces sp. Isolate_45]MDA5284765.1 conjugal transfer protein [Streptomyces sp. Isolate_45]